MKHYIQTAQGTYLIRGNWTVRELHAQYKSFLDKYKSKLIFDRWLVERGKVYFRKPAEQGGRNGKG